MMITFVISFIIVALAVLGLSLGVIFGRRSPQSCAGAANHDGCGSCQRNCENREHAAHSHMERN